MRKLKLTVWALGTGVLGFGLLWWKAGWIVALAVFIICWSQNIDRLIERE